MDMSKAYDRVEWKFIQEILYKMGFEHHWTKNNGGMYLFGTVQSLIKWSTKRTHNSKGLCQGDYLSPYLFITSGVSALRADCLAFVLFRFEYFFGGIVV